ncbi:hypothetical protein BKA65DRAFT_474155 [Rhexocercosporidium sp. MPI-PUGE-AT-0058]|nr:hypothetical protein BKA65DRAFT_474155 [Rhexocercosporidium sp. MPI-PUGE-AT-0058]
MASTTTLLIPLMTFLLLTTSTSALPSSPNPTYKPVSNIHTPFPNTNHTADLATILPSRSATWQPGEEVVVTIEDGPFFPVVATTCKPNVWDKEMCTVAYVEKSRWNGWAVMWVYDNQCNLVGYNDHVARNWLAARWSFATSRPMYVDVRIANWWDQTHADGIDIWYGSFHTEPFLHPIKKWKPYLWGALFPVNENGQVAVAWRAPIVCI